MHDDSDTRAEYKKVTNAQEKVPEDTIELLGAEEWSESALDVVVVRNVFARQQRGGIRVKKDVVHSNAPFENPLPWF